MFIAESQQFEDYYPPEDMIDTQKCECGTLVAMIQDPQSGKIFGTCSSCGSGYGN